MISHLVLTAFLFVQGAFLIWGTLEASEHHKRVLVTGGAGYIGTQTCKQLAKAGYSPVVYDNLINGHAESVQWGVLEEGDIGDRARLLEVLEKHQPIAVIHLAALKAVGESIKEPGKYYQNNVCGTLNLLDTLREKGIDKIVFSSTAAVYGTPSTFSPIQENARLDPINPYGQSKHMVERILADYRTAYGLEYVALRYFNAAGADLHLECGEHSKYPKNLIPIVLQVAKGEREFLEIYGTDYPTPDGTAIRDYIHVVDLANAHILALDYLLVGGPSVTLNLGTGVGVSVREVVDAVEEITGHPIPFKEASRREGDPAYLTADASLAKEVLGWVPKHSDLKTIIETEWLWKKAR